MNQKKVAGVGIYEPGRFVSVHGVEITSEYKAWNAMLRRCQPNGAIQKKQPAYIGCSVHPDFIKFQDFAEWCQTQIGFGNSGWQLDKDIIKPGNKVYGPDTCCFVPQEINKLFNLNLGKNSPYPTGVSWCNRTSRFMATIKIDGSKKFLGRFDTIKEAETAYLAAKRKHVVGVATHWRDQIDPRVYDAMINWG